MSHAQSNRRQLAEIQPGARFGRLITIARGERGPHGHPRWVVKCDCGVVKTIAQAKLRTGKTKSCGCLNRETASRRLIARMTTHGGTGTPEFIVWENMRARCTRPSSTHWKHYGGRGIKVCDRWMNSFDAFLADMGPRPHGMTLDRKDVNGDYEPSNCRWATASEQARNTRCTRLIEWRGESLSITTWAERVGIAVNTLRARIDGRGWAVDRALTQPVETKFKRSSSWRST